MIRIAVVFLLMLSKAARTLSKILGTFMEGRGIPRNGRTEVLVSSLLESLLLMDISRVRNRTALETICEKAAKEGGKLCASTCMWLVCKLTKGC